jgi:hypothetical protein
MLYQRELKGVHYGGAEKETQPFGNRERRTEKETEDMRWSNIGSGLCFLSLGGAGAHLHAEGHIPV